MELLQGNLGHSGMSTVAKVSGSPAARPSRRGMLAVLWVLSCLGCLAVGGAGGFWAALRFFVATPVAETSETITQAAQTSSMDEALSLIRTARERFKDVKDYRCIYLRDEVIDNQMQMNTMNLLVRHRPFSVCMEWLAPAQKRGRKAMYVDGMNDNKMLVKQLITLRMDPGESIKRKESRHTILEAGIKNLIDRYTTAWEREKILGKTDISIGEQDEKITIGEQTYFQRYRVVTARHPADGKGEFEFYFTKVCFDKETGLPLRTECYDFPDAGHPDGRLVERYTYIDLKPNVGLTDRDFGGK